MPWGAWLLREGLLRLSKRVLDGVASKGFTAVNACDIML